MPRSRPNSTPLAPVVETRRRLLQGGLLAAAAALGLLPESACSQAAGGAAAGPARKGGGGPGAGSGGSGAGTGLSGAGGVAAGGSALSGDARAPESDAGSGGLPRRPLGRTGVEVPILGLGTSRLGQRGGNPSDADYQTMLDVFGAAIDRGIHYIDTGAIYGRAEEALGELVPSWRPQIFLATKVFADTYAQASMQFERSLERLRTDYVDVLHLHSVGQRDLDVVLSGDGAWRYILEQKAKGRARFVGVTGHNRPDNFMRMLATDEVDVLMTIMNFVDHSTYGLSRAVREEAISRGVGILAMKVFGGTESVLAPGGGLANSNAPVPHPSNMELAFDETVLPDCMRFAKSLEGVSAMVIGVNHRYEVERNVRWAFETEPFSPEEMDAIIQLGAQVAPMWAQRYD